MDRLTHSLMMAAAQGAVEPIDLSGSFEEGNDGWVFQGQIRTSIEPRTGNYSVGTFGQGSWMDFTVPAEMAAGQRLHASIYYRNQSNTNATRLAWQARIGSGAWVMLRERSFSDNIYSFFSASIDNPGGEAVTFRLITTNETVSGGVADDWSIQLTPL